MRWTFPGGIAFFGTLAEGNQFMFNSCESGFKFLKSPQLIQQRRVQGIKVMLQVGEDGFNFFQPLFYWFGHI